MTQIKVKSLRVRVVGIIIRNKKKKFKLVNEPERDVSFRRVQILLKLVEKRKELKLMIQKTLLKIFLRLLFLLFLRMKN